MRYFLFIVFLGALTFGYAQERTQNIRGTVVDLETNYPLVGSKVKIVGDSSEVIKGAIVDENGNFSITNVAVGKHNLEISSIGYLTKLITVVVISGKETIVNIQLEESAIVGNEVVVSGRKKGEVINEMATVSAQTFSVEETNRYAGSRGDPARMMSNYAGAQGTDDSRNDLVIRGNSPLGIAYRIEGICIPNPNHFSVAGSTGGPVSILNNKFLDNSDFFMSAFPAEYGNSNSGVFDLRLRQGNDQLHEFSGQFGFLGTEVLLEGPLSKKTGASYLMMGRYSTLSLFDKIGIQYGTDAVPSYWDGAFKFNFPLNKGGVISFWGLGGNSNIDILISDQTEPTQDAYGEQDRDQRFGTSMLATGLTYKKSINKNSFFKASVAYSFQNQRTLHEYILRHLDSSNQWVYDADPFPMMGYNYSIHTISGYASYNHKFNSKNLIKFGINVDSYIMDMQDSIRYDISDSTSSFYYRWNYTSSTPEFLIQPFVQWKYKPTNRLTLNAGLHSQYFTMSNSISPVEPRVGLKYALSENSVIAFGAGMHSQTLPLYIYTYHQLDAAGNQILHNKNVDFTRSIHTVLSYSHRFKKSMFFKSEIYYQHLYNVGVEVNPSSYSVLNQGSGFARFFPDSLNNDGSGKNYGIEFTLQKFFDNSFFFMGTASLYQSLYTGSDGIERNTDFNSNYIFNILAGKEFTIKDKHTISIGTKFTYAGGKRYGYVDVAQSNIQKEIIWQDSGYNTRQFVDYLRLDFRVTYIINGKKVSHEIGLDMVNALNTQNILGLTYTPTSPGSTAPPYTARYQLGLLPIFYYRIDFKVAGE